MTTRLFENQVVTSSTYLRVPLWELGSQFVLRRQYTRITLYRWHLGNQVYRTHSQVFIIVKTSGHYDIMDRWNFRLFLKPSILTRVVEDFRLMCWYLWPCRPKHIVYDALVDVLVPQIYSV